MDVKYINPFLTATVHVVKTMAFTDLTPGSPYLKKGATAHGDISGIIGLTGDVTGSLSVSFTFPLLKEIIKNMLGDEISDISDDVRDTVGEMTNMISGDARRLLQQEGLNLSAAIPTIISGKNHTIKHVIQGPIIVIPFTANGGKAVVEISME